MNETVTNPGTWAESSNGEDLVLLSKVATGDRRAFDKLSNKHIGLIRRLANRHTRDSDIAEDVITEALMRIFRSAGTYKSQSLFTTWLSRIVINCAIDADRRQKRTDMLTFEQAFDGFSAADAPIEDPNWEAAFTPVEFDHSPIEMMKSQFFLMDDRKRELMLLSYRDEVSYREIGHRFSMPIGTVKSRLSRTRDELREQYTRAAAMAA